MTANNLGMVQALRAVAAISVTLVHFNWLYLHLIGTPDATEFLYPLAAGVDVFFVISGFIMVYSSEKLFGEPGAPRIFLARRIARIVPIYWVTTAVDVWIENKTFDLQYVLKSFFFIPYAQPSGQIVPVFGVGWTLNFEMFFYVLFALAIMFRRDRAVMIVSVLLLGFVALGQFMAPLPVPLAYWSDPIVVEFIFGMGLALAYRRGYRVPASICLCVGLIALGVMLQFAAGPVPSGSRWLIWGVPAALITGSVVLARGSFRVPIAVMALGNASYSIYLTHTLMAGTILITWSYGLNRRPPLLVLAAGIAMVLVLSVAIYYLFERPVTQALQRLLGAAGPEKSTARPAPQV